MNNVPSLWKKGRKRGSFVTEDPWDHHGNLAATFW
jgi:hypothetical protein